MEKKVALIDVCDCVADLRPAAIKEAGLILRPEDCTRWDIFELISPEEGDRVKALFDNPEFWRSLPTVKNVHEGLEALMRQDYRIHFLTSPWFTCPNWDGVRRAWLTEQFSWFHPLAMTSTAEKYRFDGDILVDDRPKHVISWQERHPNGKSWCFDMDFNKFFSWPNKAQWSSEGIKAVSQK